MIIKVKDVIDEVENASTEGISEHKPQFLILDSHYLEGTDTDGYRDIDYIEYRYKPCFFNRVNPGDWFVYRKPQKATNQRRFYFYGIGKVLEISSGKTPNDDSIIKVGSGHKFIRPLFQNDNRLIDFEWELKGKPIGGNFVNFFNQYGMNLITKNDFMGLFGEMECIPAENCSINQSQTTQLEAFSEEEIEFECDKIGSFSLNIHSEEVEGSTKTTREFKPRKTDFDRINKNKKKLGTLGELLVKEMEKKSLIEAGRPDLAEQVNHVAAEADGHGYDLISFDPLTNEVKYIEVKTTKSKRIDGFYMSPKEIQVSEQFPDNYYIYRLFNLNIEEKIADLKIFKGAIGDDNYNCTPVSFKITLK